jgi:hypothetical protein
MDYSATFFKIFCHFVVLGRSELSSSSTDTRPALKRECNWKAAVRLKECSQNPNDEFQKFW